VPYKVKRDFTGESGQIYIAGTTLWLHPTDEDVSNWLIEDKIEVVDNSGQGEPDA
jgi:hypothetical protein